MKLVRRRSTSAAVLTAVTAALTLGIVGGSVGPARAAYDPANPPYPADPNAVATLTIVDVSSGAVVTGGSSSTTLDHYYFEAKDDFNPGHTKAAVSGYLAEAGKAPGAFSGEGLGPATTYPVGSVTQPTAKGDATASFASLAGAYPNTALATSDFAGLYQLRVKTTFPAPQSDSYAKADIQIDTAAGTWHVASAAGGGGGHSTIPTISVTPTALNVGKAATIVVRGTAGDPVTLLGYSRPSTTFKTVRSGTIGAGGSVTFSVAPRTNTKVFARTAAGASSTAVISVRPAESLKGTAAGRTVHFTGQLVPGHGGVTVRVFTVKSGKLTLVGKATTTASGAWAFTHTFATVGAVTFISQTLSDLTNLAGQSNRISLTLR